MHIEELVAKIEPVSRYYIKEAQKRFDNLIKPVGSLAQLERMTSRYAAILGSADKNLVKIPEHRLLLLWGGVNDQKPIEEAFNGKLPIVTVAKEVNAKTLPLMVIGDNPLELLEEGAMLTTEYIGEEKADIVLLGTVTAPIPYKDWHGLMKLEVLEEKTGFTFNPEHYDECEDDEEEGCCSCGHHHAAEKAEEADEDLEDFDENAPVSLDLDRASAIMDKLEGQDTKKFLAVTSFLEKLGAPCVCAMAGAILVAAGQRVPVILDGVATCLAAFAASKLNPAVLDYVFAGHVSAEEGMEEILDLLGLEAPLRLNIPNSSGVGAATCLKVFDAGIKAYTEMETFAEAGVHAEKEDYSLKKQQEKQNHA